MRDWASSCQQECECGWRMAVSIRVKPRKRLHHDIMKVLLIENSHLYHIFLSQLFANLGYQPVVAISRKSALNHLRKDSFEIVCMNMYFEGAIAIDFVSEIRLLDEHVAVIMLTSEKDDRIRSKALRAGITEVIYKSNVRETASLISCFVKEHIRPDLKNSRVLYVEDSRTEAAVIKKVLKSMGLNVVHFRSAEEAMERLRSDQFDLVITDVLLKGQGSGLSLVRHIRTLPGPAAQVPVLTLTGFDDHARRIELLRAGTTDYVTKPVIKEELMIRVANLVTNKRLNDKVVRQQAQLYEMAVTDQLTRCYNRHGFTEFANRYIANAVRRAEPVGMLMLDLDFFKSINDTHGHDMGDQVLTAVGALLARGCRADDLIARYGGEEFVVLIPNCSKRQALAAAERLRKSVERLQPGEIKITVSIGVTHTDPSRAVALDNLFCAADKAVYRAKARGRNCVSFRQFMPSKSSACR